MTDTTGELILVDRRGDYAVLTLNRPDKRNAISRALAAELNERLRDLESVKVIVITGAGDAFCAGLDLKERVPVQGWQASLGIGQSQFWADTIEAIRRHPAIVIAAVNGTAVAGGLTLVNAVELAVASDTAQFGMPEMGFGSFPAQSGPAAIKRILPKHAAQLIFTAQRVDAATALAWGIVNEVVPRDEVLDRACALAEQIAALDARALAFGKRAVHELQELDWRSAMDHGVFVSTLVRNYTESDSPQGPTESV